jgi:hypothetical protein
MKPKKKKAKVTKENTIESKPIEYLKLMAIEKEKKQEIWKKLIEIFSVDKFVKERDGFNWMTETEMNLLTGKHKNFTEFLQSNFFIRVMKENNERVKYLKLRNFTSSEILKLFECTKTKSLKISEIIKNLPLEIKGKIDKLRMIQIVEKICEEEIFYLVGSTVFLKQEMDFLSNEELKKKLFKKLLTGVSIYKKVDIEIAFGWMNRYEISLISGSENFIDFLKAQKDLIVTKDQMVQKLDPVVEKIRQRTLRMFSKDCVRTLPYKNVLKELKKIHKIKSGEFKQLLSLDPVLFEKRKKELKLKSHVKHLTVIDELPDESFNVDLTEESVEGESSSEEDSLEGEWEEIVESTPFFYSISFKSVAGIPLEIGCAKIDLNSNTVLTTFHECFMIPEPTMENQYAYIHSEKFKNGLPCSDMSKIAKIPIKTIWKKFNQFIKCNEEDEQILFAIEPLQVTKCLNYICNQLKVENTFNICGLERFIQDLLFDSNLESQIFKFLNSKEKCEIHKEMNPLFECALEDACSIARFLKFGKENGFDSFLNQSKYKRPKKTRLKENILIKSDLKLEASFLLKQLNEFNFKKVKLILENMLSNFEVYPLVLESIFECAGMLADNREFLNFFDVYKNQKSFEETIIQHCLNEIQINRNSKLNEKELNEFIKNIEFIENNFKENQSLSDEISGFKEIPKNLISKQDDEFEKKGISFIDSDVENESLKDSEGTNENVLEMERKFGKIDDEVSPMKQEIVFEVEEFTQQTPENIKEEINALIALLPQKYIETLHSEDLTNLIEIEMDFNRTPKAHFFKNRILKLSKDLVSMEEIQHVTAALKILPNNRSGIEKHLHRISVIRNYSKEIIGATLRIGKPFYGISTALKDILDSKKSILFLGSPGSGKTSEKKIL